MKQIEILYQKLEDSDLSKFYTIGAAFCVQLYYHIPASQRPPCADAFLTVSNWHATSRRSRVWIFYEAASDKDIATTLQFLEKSGETELASIFRLGAHDYKNPIYSDNFDYPEDWITEADTIDEWIKNHEKKLYLFERSLLLDNRELLCTLCGE